MGGDNLPDRAVLLFKGGSQIPRKHPLHVEQILHRHRLVKVVALIEGLNHRGIKLSLPREGPSWGEADQKKGGGSQDGENQNRIETFTQNKIQD